MIYQSRFIPLLLSMVMAATSVGLFYFFAEGLTALTFLTLFAIVFISGFLLSYFILDRLVFGPIKTLKGRIEKLGIKSEDDRHGKDSVSDALEVIASDIDSFAAENQQEIDRLKKLEAFRKDFIADVSHELKTPIFAAQGFVHTLLDGAVKEKAVRKKFLKKAAKSLDGLDMLVQDLLTLSQIETGQIKMRFAEVDLYELTEEVFEQFKAKISKKDVTLRVEKPVKKAVVYADGQRIGQVLTNLISNAIKHSEAGGEVIVSFSVRKSSVVTRIKDFGEGIAAEHINRIFERFYRVDKSRSREKGGTGLGLAIVKHILEGHKSKAHVESEPGKGSTFSFKLPRVKGETNGIQEHDE